MIKYAVLSVSLFLVNACASPALEAPAGARERQTGATFVYADLDAFATAMRALDGGADLSAEMQRYVANGSPAFGFFAERFGATADSMTQQVRRRPLYYRYLTTLKPELQAMEPRFRAALALLRETAPPGSSPVPLYFLIANQTAGGNPGMVETPQGRLYFVALALDAMAMSPRVDMSEFPNGAGGRASIDEIPYVVVHETSHVYQRQLQGADNYRSMYVVDGRGTNLAYAVREGCADFLTELVSGWTIGTRETFVAAHERALWTAFESTMRNAEDDASGWFGAPSQTHPDWPSGREFAAPIMSPRPTSALRFWRYTAPTFRSISRPLSRPTWRG